MEKKYCALCPSGYGVSLIRWTTASSVRLEALWGTGIDRRWGLDTMGGPAANNHSSVEIRSWVWARWCGAQIGKRYDQQAASKCRRPQKNG